MTLVKSLQDNPSLDRWLTFENGAVRLAVGKVELGQGIATALTQIAAEELDVALARITLIAGDTDAAPDEGLTVGSMSIEMSGASVRLVCAEVRALFLQAAALRLNCSPAELSLDDGAVLQGAAKTGLDYWNLAPEVSLARPVTAAAPVKPASSHKIVGTSAPRRDLPEKLAGSGFVHDLVFPDMLHARVLRLPGSILARIPTKGVRLIRRDNFAALVGEDETAVHRAAVAATWTPVRVLGDPEALRDRQAEDVLFGPPMPDPAGRVSATYSRPFIAHASIGPSCAVAQFRDGHLTVWSHTQGVYLLRALLNDITGVPTDAISVRHGHGAGCYGHNGADDVAIDAALVALQTEGRPVRLLWRREDEFSAEPLGSAMQVTVSAALDAAGRPVDWTTDIWSCAHNIRGTSPTTLARRELADPPPWPVPREMPPEMGGGASRNSLPLYDIAQKRALVHLIQSPPVRTSALRGLGALPNIFAIECFLDELAERAGRDPVAYRLALMVDPRARKVIETAAAMADWSNRFPGREGRGLGIGFGQYKNRSAYAAVVMEVEVDREVRLTRAWCAADGGLIINPDGARNQIEGGIIQAASMTLREQVRFNDSGVASTNWDLYPILRFSEIPEIETQLIDAREHPSLGMGECTMGPTAAAIGNAVAHALGARIRDMPLTRERIAEVLVQT